jgi:hypothetical protein
MTGHFMVWALGIMLWTLGTIPGDKKRRESAAPGDALPVGLWRIFLGLEQG